ncbi:ComF family protein [Anaplasma bovis]|uniref:ComF family protein n=1 Tax=Anaplasma bovis TaxID=186733 RepID=UPI002FEF7547
MGSCNSGVRLSVIFHKLVEVFFPLVCANCRAVVQRTSVLCSVCWQNIKFMRDDMCEHCGVMLPGNTVTCASCRTLKRHTLESRSVFIYDDVSKHLILRFKFLDDLCFLNTYALWMAEAGREILKTASLLVPVPIHRTRLFLRKYNQSSLLAHAVGKLCKLPVDALSLKKVINTKSQHNLVLSQRETNVKGSFRVTSPAKVSNKSIVLIDDIITTGATAKECATMLLEAGAAEVKVLTLGKTVLGK